MTVGSFGAICPTCGSQLKNNQCNRYRTIDGKVISDEFYTEKRYAIINLAFSPMGSRILWLHIDPIGESVIDDNVAVIALSCGDFIVNYRRHPMAFDELGLAHRIIQLTNELYPDMVFSVVPCQVLNQFYASSGMLPIAAMSHWHTKPHKPLDNSLWMEWSDKRRHR